MQNILSTSFILRIQLSKSSRAFFGGAYFSAVSGWKSIPISVPGPYECLECNRLLGFCLTITFLPCITFTIDQCTVSKRFDRISQQSAKMDFSSMILSISYEHLSIMMMIMLPSLDCPQYLHVIPNSPKNESWIFRFLKETGLYFSALILANSPLYCIGESYHYTMCGGWWCKNNYLILRLIQISSQTLYFLFFPINQFHISQRIIAQKTSEPRVAP